MVAKVAVQSIEEDLGLADIIDAETVASLEAKVLMDKKRDQLAIEADDIRRLKKIFTRKNFEDLITQALEKERVEFNLVVPLGDRFDSKFRYIYLPISREVLYQLNKALKSNPILRKIKYSYWDGSDGTRFLNKDLLIVKFRKPNNYPGLISILAKRASVGIAAVKGKIAAHFQESPEVIQQFKSEFCNDFRTAVEATIKAEKTLADTALKQDPEFSLDVAKLAQLSSRHIELIKVTRYGSKPVLGERTVLTTLENLTADMNEASKMVNPQPELLAKINEAFDSVVQDIDLRVQAEENKQSIEILGNLDFGMERLAQRALKR